MHLLERISNQIVPADLVFYDWQLALSTRLQQIMESKNVNEKEFAEMIGVTDEELDDLLHFCANPPLSLLARISALTQADLLTWGNSDIATVGRCTGEPLASQ